MVEKQDLKKDGYVKKDTLLVVALVALIIGFFGGVAFTVYKSGSDSSTQVSVAPQQVQPVQQGSDVSAETAAKIFELENKTSQNPDDVVAWIQLGNLHFDAKNYSKSIEAYKKSLELDPNNANVITDMGVMYRRSGKPDEAIKSFERAIQVDPKHETARFNTGIVLMHDLNDVEGTIKIWEKLIEVNPVAVAPGGQSVDSLIQQLKKTK